MKQRLENSVNEIETLRKRHREEQIKHKEEVTQLRQETMRIRKLESELKSLHRVKEKTEEQLNVKLEKESGDKARLVDKVKEAELRIKEL